MQGTNQINYISYSYRKGFKAVFSSHIFWAIVLIFLYMLPNLILGQDSYVFFFDTWDSEILFYNLNAKYFFDFNGTMPEIMNGLPVASVNVFSPVQTFIYMLLPDYWAYIFNDFWVRIIGFLGTYLLLKKLFGEKYCFIAFFAGIILAYLPVFSVYGTSIFGQPMLIYAVWNLIENKQKFFSYAYIVFFGLSSSLILTGFYILAIIFVLAIVFNIKKGFKASVPLYISFLIILCCYLLTNFKMIYNLLFADFESMRVERVIGKHSIIDFLVLFFGGHMHAISVQVYAFLVLVPMLVILFIKLKKKDLDNEDKRYLNIIWVLLGYNLLAALINELYFSDFGVFINSKLGFLNGFQYRRLFFSYPVTWNLIFASSLYLLVKWRVFDRAVNWILKFKKPAVTVLSVLLVFLFSFSITAVYETASKWQFKYVYFENVKRIFYRETVKEDYASYNQYIDKELFGKIKTHIGKDVQDYRVVSVGMYPVIASMNGFYTLDGYFQLYGLDYKHDFREIIADELKKDEALKLYFDEWGNKCYVFSAELGRSYLFSKESGKAIKQLDINTQKLKEMGGEYIFSAVEIQNYNDLGLKFEGNFTTPKSYFNIYLYKVV